MDRKLCQEIGELLDRVGEPRAARELGVHRTTLYRWRMGRVRPPESSLCHLRQLVHHIPDPAWRGWYFEQGLLWCEEGYAFKPGEVIAGRFDRKVIEFQREEIAKLKAEIARLSAAAGSANDGKAAFIGSGELPLRHVVESGRGVYDPHPTPTAQAAPRHRSSRQR